LSTYARTWAAARAAFRARAAGAGLVVDVVAVDGGAGKGPGGEDLVIDVARSAVVTDRVFVFVSGVHGVEGFAGAHAAGVALADSVDGATLWRRAGASVLFVHGVNPFGMLWGRRVNGDNIDLNRNFGALPVPLSPLYPRVRALPTSTTPLSLAAITARLALYGLRHGIAPTKQALVGGQSVDAHGLFFTGVARSAEAVAVVGILARALAQARRVVVVDWHTGLGPRGEDTLLVVPHAEARVARHLGFRVLPLVAEGSSGYEVAGDLTEALPQAAPHAAIDFVTQEFGTVSPQRAFHALQRENAHWQRGERAPDHPARRALLAAYDGGDDPRWVAGVEAATRRLLSTLPALMDDAPTPV
jgi:hypothetical protein